jgi:outer membrane protein assembly factor BamB
MSHTWLVAVLVLALTRVVDAGCPPSCPVPGGGAVRADCHAEFASTALRLNYPPFDPAHPRRRKLVRCFDGEPGCDVDGQVNGACVVDADVCLLRSADPALPLCTPAEVTATEVIGAAGDAELGSLDAALAGLLPSTADACTTGQTFTVPLGVDARGRFVRRTRKLRLRARTARDVDADTLKVTCVPHGWPSHGYDAGNHRATPLETALSPATAALLRPKWQLALDDGTNNGVTSTPTVGGGMVFVTAWNGFVYGVSADSGVVRWRYDTGSGGGFGVQSSATLTADGRVLVGDSNAVLHCLDARRGRLLWRTPLGNPAVDHIWASPTVANGRVLIGVASHNDVPCTQGRLVGLDLDTGAVLWTRKTVPDRICHDATSVACTIDADCPGGTCDAARGAGVTATVAVDATGETAYMNTVGCFTFPSVGDSDSLFRVDAATGATSWITRVKPPEPFSAIPYHDFGFLNGPMLIDGGTGTLVVSGSKDGTLYALDAADGALVWTNVVAPTPVSPAFAGFGLFNGGLGFADGRIHAALNDFIPPLAVPPLHLQAFDPADGTGVWAAEIGASWGSVALAGGLVFVGTNAALEYYVYDAALGTRLATLALPATTASGASVVDGSVYVGYGISGPVGGVQALALP